MKLIVTLCRCTVLAVPLLSAYAQTSQVAKREVDLQERAAMAEIHRELALVGNHTRISEPPLEALVGDLLVRPTAFITRTIAAANSTGPVAIHVSNVAPK